MSTISFVHQVSGVNTDVTSVVFSDSTAAYGVRRNDTDASVVALNTALTYISTGTYEYTFDDPANDLTYEYGIKYVYLGGTNYIETTQLGPTSSLGGTTLANLITRIRRNTNRLNSADVTDTEITTYVNEALLELARRHYWKDLHTNIETALEVDTFRYSLPTDCKEVFSMRMINGTASKLMRQRTREWEHHYEPNPTSTGSSEPRYYILDGNNYEVYPLPDTAYTWYIDYQKWPAILSASATSATPDIDLVDDAIAAYGSAELFRRLSQFDEADHWESRFERAYKRAQIQDGKRPDLKSQMDGVVTQRHANLPAAYYDDPLVGL